MPVLTRCRFSSIIAAAMKPKMYLAVILFLSVLTLPLGVFGQQTAKDFLNRGRQMEQGGYCDAAFTNYSKAIELDPKFAPASHARGNLKFRRGDLDGAIADFTKAIESNPENYTAAYDRGRAKKAKGDRDGAIADFTQVIEHYPKSANRFFLTLVFNNRGDLKKAKGDLNGAIADYTQVIELFPNTREAFYANLQFLREYEQSLVGRCARVPEFASIARRPSPFLGDLEETIRHTESQLRTDVEYWKKMNQRLLSLEASMQQLEESISQAEINRNKPPSPPSPPLILAW